MNQIVASVSFVVFITVMFLFAFAADTAPHSDSGKNMEYINEAAMKPPLSTSIKTNYRPILCNDSTLTICRSLK